MSLKLLICAAALASLGWASTAKNAAPPPGKKFALDVVNMRIPGGGQHGMGRSDGSIAEQFGTLAKLRQQGLIRHLGVSNATFAQIAEAQGIAPVVCVQNFYNIVHREDDSMVDDLAAQGIAYVPFFPLGGFTPLQSDTLLAVAKDIGATPMQIATVLPCLTAAMMRLVRA